MAPIAKRKVKGKSPLANVGPILAVVGIKSVQVMGQAVLETMCFGVGVGAGLVVGAVLLSRHRRFDTDGAEPESLQKQLDDEKAQKRMQALLPEWVRSPDVERVNWLNTGIARLWPRYVQALQKMFTEKIWPGAKEKLPDFLDIQFKTLSLGVLPPCLEGVKAIDTVEDEMILETTVSIATNCNVIADVTFKGFKTTVQLTQLTGRGKMRAVFRPLTNSFPCFAAIEISMLGGPSVDGGVSALGGLDMMALAPVRLMVDQILAKALQNVMIWPRRIFVAVQRDKLLGREHVGMLEVHVAKARSLVAADLLGRADPYIKLLVEADKPVWTRPKNNTTSPEWDETKTIPVKDLATQQLTLFAMDAKIVGKDKPLGCSSIPLAQLAPGVPLPLELELSRPPKASARKGVTSYGVLDVSVTYWPFEQDDGIDPDVEGEGDAVAVGGQIDASVSSIGRSSTDTGAQPPGSSLFEVRVQRGQDLEARGSVEGSNCYCKLYLGTDVRRTRVVTKTTDPEWDETFEFFVPEKFDEDLHLHIEVWHKNVDKVRVSSGKRSLGTLDISVLEVKTNGRLTDLYQLNQVKTGLLKLEMSWKSHS